MVAKIRQWLWKYGGACRRSEGVAFRSAPDFETEPLLATTKNRKGCEISSVAPPTFVTGIGVAVLAVDADIWCMSRDIGAKRESKHSISDRKCRSQGWQSSSDMFHQDSLLSDTMHPESTHKISSNSFCTPISHGKTDTKPDGLSQNCYGSKCIYMYI